MAKNGIDCDQLDRQRRGGTLMAATYVMLTVLVGATRHGRGPSLPRRNPGAHRSCDR